MQKCRIVPRNCEKFTSDFLYEHKSDNFFYCISLSSSNQVQHLTPQLINAGTIKMSYPENKAAEENFENLSRHFAGGITTIRDLCDESIDVKTFMLQTQHHIKMSIQKCEESVKQGQSTQVLVDNSALAARSGH